MRPGDSVHENEIAVIDELVFLSSGVREEHEDNFWGPGDDNEHKDSNRDVHVRVTETTETSSFDYTETTYLDVATETLTPIWTVERFVVKTVAPAPRRRDVDGLDAKDIFGREARTTSICHSTVQPKACKCLITSCTPVATKDLRKTIKEKTTDTTWVIIEQGITYTNTEWIPSLTTETQSYTWIEVSGILSTHSTTIKCTPSASPTNPSFYLQATSYPPPRPAASTMPINGQYYWAAALSPRLLSFSIEAAFTPDILEASVFSLDSKKRLHTAHKNGTQYANVDHYSHFPIAHLMGRGEITRRSYEYLRCEPRPPSGRFPGGYQELYCLADGFWHRDTWNYCPLYKEYFNAPLVLGDEWSETAPDCFNVTFLIKPVCGG
ncbi:hypothetical protein DRE_03544 [Drechslerella stenobrocha 248]|uniref:Uncharacterized protein n=1 Tax=Drechslerella stenobrocha 248 TaxID=1043628 RepID=W7IDV8_9PEZI|nr:hypothetical protein DRE_03544 [Drechslerella stenobrocha 248]